ncbi:MAG: PocR ligand-binding domain-containing protein [Desulfuromonadaceae bacterium]|nr:PocR ligand-binding domain-containing protein [Desulfuromonadaceae bacterium]
MGHTLKDILDIPRLSELLDSMGKINNMPTAILDREGNILIATAWQDICVKFHRVNAESRKKCLESDKSIGAELDKKMPHVIYRCPMGLVDAIMPIIVEGEHLGNVFTGQLFNESPDKEYFIKQAHQYGFDESKYLAAMRTVPFFTEEELLNNLAFIHSLTQMLAEQGLQYRRQCETEAALKRNEELIRRVIASSNDCIKVLDLEGRLLSMSEGGQKALEIDGVNPFLGLSCMEFWKDDKESAQRAVAKAASGEVSTFYGYCETLKGTPKWWEVVVSPMIGADNTIENLLAISRDITERRVAEEALKWSEYFFKESQRSASIGSYHADFIAGRWKSSEVLDAIFGIDEDYVRSIQGWLDIVHPDDRYMMDRYLMEEVISNHNSFSMEYRIIRKNDGETRWVNGLGSAEFDKNGNTLSLMGTIQDITERKQIEAELLLREQALANSERFLKTIIDSEPECIKMLDIDGNLLMMNPAGLEMIDADSFEEVKGQCVFPLITDTYRDDFIALTKQVFQGVSGILEFETIGLKGRHVWLETHAVSFRDERGEIVALLGITRDITEQKRLKEERVVLEQQFQQAQKMESLGVLAGGIAHDFNNLLAVIIGHCSLAKLRPITAVDNIPQIEAAAERAAALCQQMLAYAGKANITKSLIHLEDLVSEMVNMSKSTIGQNVKISCDFAPDISPIKADASQIRQVVMNLIINAAEAVGELQGEVRVSLSKRTVRVDQQEKDHLGAIIPAGYYICLEITDNGCGMNGETRQRIFEPFYTTKFTGRGLGMSAVLGIIKSHNGALQLFSQLAEGTTFKVYLPIQTTGLAAGQPQQETRPPTSWKGSGTILLVEDEEQVICVAEIMLKDLGFTVIKAYNGKEGLELYQQNKNNITLVVTDIGMPIMDGYALISELKKLKPELPVIISSGFGEVDIISHLPGGEIASLINKPYNFIQLRDVIQRVTEGVSSAQAC